MTRYIMMYRVTFLIVHYYWWHSLTRVAIAGQPRRPATWQKLGRAGRPQLTVFHSCPNMVYCQGELLDTVQKQKLYKDSKTFVDMSQKHDESVTLANFDKLKAKFGENPSKKDVQAFVDENFEFVNETESWTPHDFKSSPVFLDKIQDSEVKSLAKTLVSLWPLLGRRIKESVKANPSRHSLIPVPRGFIVPGGRFREIYYWDTYWIIKGLLISEMTDTVQGMLENFIFLIQNYGLIPNGSRLYYLNRSQPPLFTLMVALYFDYTNDIQWLKSNIGHLETELNFWLDNRTVEIHKDEKTYKLAHYGTLSNTPRPESYAEDLDTCSHAQTKADERACYNALKTAAETGWDFSTRWIFDERGGIKANLSFIDSQRVLPVDLNAFLCKSFRSLSEMYGATGDASKQRKWAVLADQWQSNIELFLYSETDGIWYDYDYNFNVQRKYFFASNFAPLWADCYDTKNRLTQGEKAVEYFTRNQIQSYMGGVPTSLEASGEQWDFPNAWPPLQEFVILGLYQTGHHEARKFATEFANRWIQSNLKGFKQSGAMYEKYDAQHPGQYGGGGEYEVQLGFGWSNGVALSLIKQFSSGAFTINHFHFIIYCLCSILIIL